MSFARARMLAVVRQDDGALSMEYAWVVLAAMVFAGVLLAVIRSDAMAAYMADLMTRYKP